MIKGVEEYSKGQGCIWQVTAEGTKMPSGTEVRRGVVPQFLSMYIWHRFIPGVGNLWEESLTRLKNTCSWCYRCLGPVCRWQCSKHRLLKGWVHCLFLFPFHFIFGFIYILVSIITPYTTSHHHAYTLMSAWLTHPFHFIIMLPLMCHSCLPPYTLPPWPRSLYA